MDACCVKCVYCVGDFVGCCVDENKYTWVIFLMLRIFKMDNYDSLDVILINIDVPFLPTIIA